MTRRVVIIQLLKYGVFVKGVDVLGVPERAWKYTYQLQLPNIKLNDISPPVIYQKINSEMTQLTDMAMRIKPYIRIRLIVLIMSLLS